MKPTKLQSLMRNCKLQNDTRIGTIKTYETAIYKLGHECFRKSLQGKLLEKKYDGTIVNVDIEVEE